MDDRILPPEAGTPGWNRTDAPEGYRLVAVHDDDDGRWRLLPEGHSHRCRFSTRRRREVRRDRCPNQAKAALNRTRDGGEPARWWAYCGEHMYAHWIGADGQIWVWKLEEVGSE